MMETMLLDSVMPSLPILLKGALLSLQLFVIAILLSSVIGGVLGTLTCRRLRLRGLAPTIEGVTFVLRAVPFYVQLLIVYFVLPDLLAIELESSAAAIIALSLCSSGYIAQIVRGGLNSIDAGQWEAAYTLGYSILSTLRYIIFPQVMRNILPALTGECDSLLKSTAVLASIGVLELTRMGMNVVSREMNPLPIYLAVAALYVVISAMINITSKYLEKRLSYA
jgi:His/Glu/Gln/Arg/opine family amino acid ABC transporter permease subunit